MRRSNHTDAEIIALLKEAEDGVPIEAICATAYVSVRTFYRWRKQFGGLTPDAIRRMRLLERENRNLRLLVGRLSEKNTGGAWSGWVGERKEAPPADGAPPPVRHGRHSGSGASTGRFASLRAGRS